MKNTYFNALYLIAIVLLTFLLYMSINVSYTEAGQLGFKVEEKFYSISPWGVVIAIIWVAMLLMYFQVRKKFRNRFPRP